MPDLPPISSVRSSLAQQRSGLGLLAFSDRSDEAAYSAYRWRRARLLVRGTLTAVAAVLLAVALEYNLPDYVAQRLFLLDLFLGRVLPVAVLAVLCCLPPARVWRVWSPLACACVFVIVLSVNLQQFLCARVAGASAQCALLASGLLPWLPLVGTVVAPFVMADCLQARWHDVALWGTLASGTFVGLLLAMQTRDFIATPILLVLAALAIACASAHDREAALRDAFRREVAGARKLSSTVAAALTRAVAQEGNLRLAGLLKRLDTMVSEVSLEGTLLWCSPGTRCVLAVDPDDVLGTDTFRYVHADDAPALREVLVRLVSSGAGVAALGTPLPLGASGAAVPWERLPPETQLFARLQFRRRRADGSSGHLWVEADLWPVVRRATLLPGVQAPMPPGETSVLMVERDVTWERRRAQQAGLAVATTAAAQLPVSLNALELVRPPEARDKEWAQRLSALAAGAGGGEGGHAPTILFDPFFERALYTATASLVVPLAAARVASLTALALVAKAAAECVSLIADERQQATLAGAAPASEPPPAGEEAEPLLAASLVREHKSLMAAGRVLQAAANSSARSLQLVSEAVGIARYRCQHLPSRVLTSVSPRELVSAAVEVAQQRLLLSVTAPAPASGAAPTSDSEQAREIVFLSRPDSLPLTALVDLVKTEAMFSMALACATALMLPSAAPPAAGASAVGAPCTPILVHVEARSAASIGHVPALQLLRLVLSFDAVRIGGTDGLGAALAVDPLTSEAMACPVTQGTTERLPSPPTDGSQSPEDATDSVGATSPQALLPLLRHTVLCMGGHVTAGAASDAALLGESAISTLVASLRSVDCDPAALKAQSVLVVDLPAAYQLRPLVAGPTSVDLALVRSRIALCPAHTSPEMMLQSDPQPWLFRVTPPQGGRLAAADGAPPASSPATPERLAVQGSLPAVPAPQQQPEAQQGLATTAAAAAAGTSATAAAGARAAVQLVDDLGFHVLFVDDEQVNRKLGARMLQRLGCTCTLLEDGAQVAPALAGAMDAPYDAIMMDIVMMQTDGAEVCEELRNAGYTLPMVAMTGNTSAADVRRYMAAGFDLVLPKPFDMRAMGRALVEARQRRVRANAALGFSALPPLRARGQQQ